MSDEWGPWTVHDGSGKPTPDGMLVERIYANGDHLIARIGWGGFHYTTTRYSGPKYDSSWDWTSPGQYVPAVRYRVRKPRGMAILEAVLADLPTKVDA